jgi:hypothetical protein
LNFVFYKMTQKICDWDEVVKVILTTTSSREI